MTRPEDDYPYERNERAVILRVGTVAAVGTSTVDVDMPGGTRLTGVPSVSRPAVGAKVVVMLDGGNALAVGPVTSGPPAWAPTTGMKVFQATQTVSQPIANATSVPISWNTVEDPYGSWTAGAPTRFKPTFAGNFLLNGAVGYASIAPATYAQAENIRAAAWHRNGAIVTQAVVVDPPTVAVAVLARPYLVSLNGTTDYVELDAWQNTGESIGTNVASGYASTITAIYAGP